MKTLSPRQRVETQGAGVFIRDRNVYSRLTDVDFHRAFSEPVVIWLTPFEYKEERLDALLDAVKKLHSIQRFRFPNVAIPARIFSRICAEFPEAKIDGMKSIGEPISHSERP